MPSKSIHVVTNGKISFSVTGEYVCVCVYAYHMFFIHPSINEHLD